MLAPKGHRKVADHVPELLVLSTLDLALSDNSKFIILEDKAFTTELLLMMHNTLNAGSFSKMRGELAHKAYRYYIRHKLEDLDKRLGCCEQLWNESVRNTSRLNAFGSFHQTW